MTTAAHTQAPPAALATEISDTARLRVAWWLSWAIVPLAAAASLGGLLLDDLHQDPVSVSTRFRALDLITLSSPAAHGRRPRGCAARKPPRPTRLGVAARLRRLPFYVFGKAFNDLFLGRRRRSGRAIRPRVGSARRRRLVLATDIRGANGRRRALERRPAASLLVDLTPRISPRHLLLIGAGRHEVGGDRHTADVGQLSEEHPQPPAPQHRSGQAQLAPARGVDEHDARIPFSAISCQSRLCKPEVAGSIPARSTEERPAARAFLFSDQATGPLEIDSWSTDWSTGAFPKPMDANDVEGYRRFLAIRRACTPRVKSRLSTSTHEAVLSRPRSEPRCAGGSPSSARVLDSALATSRGPRSSRPTRCRREAVAAGPRPRSRGSAAAVIPRLPQTAAVA